MADLRFNPIARAYAAGRFDYPVEVYANICDFAGRDHFDVAVDLGCGTGLSLKGLEAISDRLIGIEPADEMRAIAAENLPEADIRKGTGDATGLEDGSSDLVTVATAFHWFDRDKSFTEIARILRPGGVFAVYRYDFPVIVGPGQVVLERHSRRYWHKYRAPVLTLYDDTLEAMEECEYFARAEHRFLPNPVPFTIADFGAFCRSTSYGSAYAATLEDGEAYFQGLEDELAAAQPLSADGTFDVTFDIYMFLAQV